MDNALQDISEADFMNGTALAEAAFTYGPPGLLEAYQNAYPKEAGNIPNAGNGGFGEIISQIGTSLSQIQQGSKNLKDAHTALKNHILDLIKKGELIPFGFQSPRNLKDTPIKIPTDLFFSGDINWNNSELIFKDLEFTGIRLFENKLPAIDMLPSPEKIEIKKQSFSDLDPELHIDEKQAAKILGISHRTLQKYRSQGGGPQFLKLKKAVRYKVSDLNNWLNQNKKRNTSEY